MTTRGAALATEASSLHADAACESADESGVTPGSLLLGSSDHAEEGDRAIPRRIWASGAVASVAALVLLLSARATRLGSAPPTSPLGGSRSGSAEPLQLQAIGELPATVAATAAVEQVQDFVNEQPSCPGGFDVPGEGWVNLVNAKINTPGDQAEKVEVNGGAIFAYMSGRTYFGDVCSDDSYDSVQYKAMNLLGRSMKWTMDLNGAACGCNAAVYLVSMAQNKQKSDCGDYYCDANEVCGVQCAEIDLQEANVHSFRATLHVPEDGEGESAGYGGMGGHTRSWGPADYGPNGKCVTSTLPFQVEVGFPVDESGVLKAMQVILSQEGKPCKIAAIVDSYKFGGKDGIARLSEALGAGMTPVISYWSNEGLGWLDGSRADPSGIIEGVCEVDTPKDCPGFVKMWDFSVFDGISEPPPTTTTTPPPATPAPAVVAQPTNPGAAAAGGLQPGVQPFIPSTTTTPAPAPPAAGAGPSMQKVGNGPWVQVFQNGQTYYFNQATGATVWDLPPGAAQ